VLSCFGDVALAIEDKFEVYLQVVLMMLFQASQTRVPEDDEDLIMYCNKLREGILEAYIGIVQGLNQGGVADKLIPYCDAIMGFLELVANDVNKDESLTKYCICCLGDLANSLGSRVPGITTKPFVQNLISEGMRSEDEGVKSDAQWAGSVIQDMRF